MKKKVFVSFVSITVILVVFLIFYIVMSVFLSIKAAQMVDSSWKNKGILPTELESVISERDYGNICPYDYQTCTVGDTLGEEIIGDMQIGHTNPFTVYKINSAVTYYQYSQEIHSKDGKLISGSWRIHCKIYWKFQNGKWVVTEYWEHI